MAIVFVAAVLAALGTCNRFNAERPVSLQILEWDGPRLTAEFPPDDRLVTGMLASVNFAGSRIHGRVVDVTASGGMLRVAVDLDALPRAGESPRSVVIDMTVPPELLKPAPEAP